MTKQCNVPVALIVLVLFSPKEELSPLGLDALSVLLVDIQLRVTERSGS